MADEDVPVGLLSPQEAVVSSSEAAVTPFQQEPVEDDDVSLLDSEEEEEEDDMRVVTNPRSLRPVESFLPGQVTPRRLFDIELEPWCPNLESLMPTPCARHLATRNLDPNKPKFMAFGGYDSDSDEDDSEGVILKKMHLYLSSRYGHGRLRLFFGRFSLWLVGVGVVGVGVVGRLRVLGGRGHRRTHPRGVAGAPGHSAELERHQGSSSRPRRVQCSFMSNFMKRRCRYRDDHSIDSELSDENLEMLDDEENNFYEDPRNVTAVPFLRQSGFALFIEDALEKRKIWDLSVSETALVAATSNEWFAMREGRRKFWDSHAPYRLPEDDTLWIIEVLNDRGKFFKTEAALDVHLETWRNDHMDVYYDQEPHNLQRYPVPSV